MNCGIINDRIRYRINPVPANTTKVDATLEKPSFSSIFTKGMKINDRSIEKSRTRNKSDRIKIRIKSRASINIHADILIIRFRLFSVIFFRI